MRVAIIAVGNPTEHWQGLFEALARKPDLELVVQVTDVSDTCVRQLRVLAAERPNLDFRLAPHLLRGEDATGHMASAVFRPGSLRGLRDFAPDVVHVIGEAGYLSTFQAIRTRNRLWPDVPIAHYAAQNVVIRFPWPFPLLERYAYRQIALALPITPAALRVLRTKGYTGAAELMPLGVDRTAFAPRAAPPAGPFTVGFVGRLEEHKGIADLVAACERLDCRLLIAGNGSLRPWLEEQAARRPGKIELLPWVERSALPALMARMHVLALPAVEVVRRTVAPWIRVPLREQFGRVLVEAMSLGVPVVATSVGEIPHVLGSAGVVVPPRDPGALAQAFADLRDRPGRAEGLARLGLARAACFDWERVAGQLADAWRGLSAGGSRSPAAAGATDPPGVGDTPPVPARCQLCGALVAPEQAARWVKDGTDIVSCASCGLLFLRELPAASELEGIYGPDYFRAPEGGRWQRGYLDNGEDEENRRLVARRRLALISPHRATGRLLDVGCASGFFLDEARAGGWSVEGVDVAPGMVAVARERFGLDAHAAEFQAVEPSTQFDCVTMWDYIEHSREPAADMRKAFASLRPGGILALSTGDAGAAFARLPGSRWHLLTPRHHNFFFTRRHLIRMLEDSGFEAVEARYLPRRATLRSLSRKLGALAPRSRIVRAAGEWLGRSALGLVAIRVNMFDVVTVVARRPAPSPEAARDPDPGSTTEQLDGLLSLLHGRPPESVR
jgi:glycosyltransferase involved in cell wall biosynthesis/SAM-dependent methyltransferase